MYVNPPLWSLDPETPPPPDADPNIQGLEHTTLVLV